MDSMRKRCRVAYTLYGLGLVAALVLMLAGQHTSALAVLVLMMVAYFLLVRPELQRYAAAWREHCIRTFCARCFDVTEYRYKGNAEALGLRGDALLPFGSDRGLMARNMAKGSKGGIDALVCDVTMPVAEPTGLRFQSGCWMRFSFPEGPCSPLRVVKGSVMRGKGYDEHLMRGEALKPCQPPDGTPEYIRYFSPSGEYALTPAAQEKLTLLLRNTPGAAVLQLYAGRLLAQFPHRLLNVSPPALKRPLTPELLNAVTFPEMEDAFALARAMKRAK